jgi:hypothetical protein
MLHFLPVLIFLQVQQRMDIKKLDRKVEVESDSKSGALVK